jgi:hypothetical protein
MIENKRESWGPTGSGAYGVGPGRGEREVIFSPCAFSIQGVFPGYAFSIWVPDPGTGSLVIGAMLMSALPPKAAE